MNHSASDRIARFLSIALYGSQHSARTLLALAEMVWCITLLLPGDSFSRPTYAVMQSFGDEKMWAALFGSVSLIQWAILFDGRYHTKFAVCFAAANMVFWWVVVISMYLAVTPPPVAISGELALAIGASWVYVRAGWGDAERCIDA